MCYICNISCVIEEYKLRIVIRAVFAKPTCSSSTLHTLQDISLVVENFPLLLSWVLFNVFGCAAMLCVKSLLTIALLVGTLWSKGDAPPVGGYNYKKWWHILSRGITLRRHWGECRPPGDSALVNAPCENCG